VKTALDLARLSRRPGAGLGHQADRGSQYTATGYRGLLECCGIVVSRSGKGEPYATALRERCFATLKAEGGERHDFQTPEPARAGLLEYRAVFYHRQRLHSSLG